MLWYTDSEKLSNKDGIRRNTRTSLRRENRIDFVGGLVGLKTGGINLRRWIDTGENDWNWEHFGSKIEPGVMESNK